MFLGELLSVLENKTAPKFYNNDTENYGIQYGKTDRNKIITKILITTDLRYEALHFAVKKKVNMILTFEPLFNGEIRKINQKLQKRLLLLSKGHFTIFILGKPFLLAENGVLENIIKMLYLRLEDVITIDNSYNKQLPVGRVCTFKDYLKPKKKKTFKQLIDRICNNFRTNHIKYVGNFNRELKRIYLSLEKDLSSDIIQKAFSLDCNCFLVRRINEDISNSFIDTDICMIELPFWECIRKSLSALTNTLGLEFPYDEFIYYECQDLIKSHLYDLISV